MIKIQILSKYLYLYYVFLRVCFLFYARRDPLRDLRESLRFLRPPAITLRRDALREALREALRNARRAGALREALRDRDTRRPPIILGASFRRSDILYSGSRKKT